MHLKAIFCGSYRLLTYAARSIHLHCVQYLMVIRGIFTGDSIWDVAAVDEAMILVMVHREATEYSSAFMASELACLGLPCMRSLYKIKIARSMEESFDTEND